MTESSPRANCFDASALVKVYSEEPGSAVVREYFFHQALTRYTTPFCFYEALNILKTKWLFRGQLSEAEYRGACSALTAWFRSSSRYIKDIDFTNIQIFNDVQQIACRHSLDLSDAFQIVSVKSGYFSALANESQTLLITADQGLATAARAEGAKAWYILGEPSP
ncbi:type II toxin-antitoxin system VapC family toxin [Acidovorax radicis]|uniref:type II toxin-antitoxin system VapC family toxin n=1 Tax=Acidovorax radicis TaxID=758826 RepID=UPI001111E03D|nr:type II toxin-antitoxin system VapC family toxin [Acidovorax radicis]